MKSVAFVVDLNAVLFTIGSVLVAITVILRRLARLLEATTALLGAWTRLRQALRREFRVRELGGDDADREVLGRQ
jgi:hypothetical protein